MKPMKICMVTTFYPPYNFGGDGVFVQRLARVLTQDGHEVHVVHDFDAYKFCTGERDAATEGEREFEIADGVQVHALGDGRAPMSDLLLTHQLGRPLKKEAQLKEILSDGFDVIHYHNVSLIGGPGVLQLGSAIKLCTLHDHWFVCAMHVLWRYNREPCEKRTCLSCTLASGRPPQLWRYTGAVDEAVAKVDAFIAPSQFARKSHISNGFTGDIRVLPHFVPSNTILTGSGSVDGKRFEERPYFMFAGRLEKIKGAQFLIELFRRYRSADLVIAGIGGYEDELKAQAHDLPHVRFVGKVTVAHLNELYRHAVASIVPSLCYETFGLVALESFAQGTPVLVHDLGALPEVIKEGGGFAYDNGASLTSIMDKLLAEPDLREKVSKEALDNLRRNYTEQRHLSEYYGMIAELRNPKSMQEVR